MRVIFLGSPAFAVPSLVALAKHDKFDVSLVVTQPDRPAGRGRALTPPPVKDAAQQLALPVFQPPTLRDETAIDRLRAAESDLLIVVAYGELLRRNVLELAPHGCLNVHPSLLPVYRGAAPIQAAILNGDARTGVSIMKLVRKLDAGPILAQHEMDIMPSDTAGRLGERLAALAADMLPATALAWSAGEIEAVPQDDGAATHTREWTVDDARIDWTRPATEIERLVRAAYPWPVTWTTLDDRRLRVLSSRVATDDAVEPPGVAALADGRLLVSTGQSRLELLEVQAPGKRAMVATDWWRGLRVARVEFD